MSTERSANPIEMRVATLADSGIALELMQNFNTSQGYPSDPSALAAAFETFVTNPELGRFWLVIDEPGPVGYLALTFGFSFEFHGRDAFVDEFYLEAAVRGRGWGRDALLFALREARALGVHAVHLEVEPTNPASALYEKAGFSVGARHLMSLRLDGAEGPDLALCDDTNSGI